MTCEITSRTDFMAGSYLVTRISENELDEHALHTIQADCPDFILPFHYKNINGDIELTYKVGTHCRLQYFSGDIPPKEYAVLWQNLLRPLLECGDWFMHPRSFVLSANYLYYDKNKKTVSYVYIPSVNGCSCYDSFHEMAIEISKMITVCDAVLENKVLRSIIKDFNPIEFLEMLKNHVTESAISAESAPDNTKLHEQEAYIEPLVQCSNSEVNEVPVLEKVEEDDVFIDLDPDVKIQQGKKERENGGYRVFSSRSKRKREAVQANNKNTTHHKMNGQVTKLIPEQEPIILHEQDQTYDAGPNSPKLAEIIDITQSISVMSGCTGLRYVGYASLPPSIQIKLSEGEIFTIGRFDTTVGKQQSSFEFDKKTKAVSRRHAVIERDIEGYKIIDLASSAGTFVNDKKLPPNTPYGLETGCRVSFGNSGADYVWEVS